MNKHMRVNENVSFCMWVKEPAGWWKIPSNFVPNASGHSDRSTFNPQLTESPIDILPMIYTLKELFYFCVILLLLIFKSLSTFYNF